MRPRSSDDSGAAAVEFAILLPLFLVLVFGMISGGLTFERWINVTQAARETSRYGATLPMANTTPTAWVTTVGGVAAESAGISLATTPASDYFICVSFVEEKGTTDTRTTKTWGTLATSASCTTSSAMADNRVEVVIKRKATFDWIFGGGELAVTGDNTSKYEPELV